MAEVLKTRTAKKAALTREINTTLKFVDSGIIDEVRNRLDKIKTKFAAVEEAHETYQASLEDENDVEQSNAWFDEVQDNYISAIKRVNSMLQDSSKPEQNILQVEPDKVKTQSEELSDKNNEMKELINVMSMPNLEIQTFNGDPLAFHSFFAIFDETVDRKTKDAGFKLNRLIQYTSGKAQTAILPCLHKGESGYQEARDILHSRFGNHHLISDTIIKDLRNGGAVRSAEDIQKLSDELCNGVSILESLNKMNEIDTQFSIVQIVDRLQPYLRNRWRREAMEMKREKDEYPSFRHLMKFIQKAAEDALDPVYGQKTSNDNRSKKTSTSFVTSASKGDKRKSYKPPPCLLCNEAHRLFYCNTFKGMKVDERIQFVKTNRLCENCLLNNHVVKDCRSPSVCTVPGCGERHTKFIHVNPVDAASGSSVNVLQTDVMCSKNLTHQNVMMPTVPVVVNGKREVSALLDTASNSSFCSKALVDQLNIRGCAVYHTLKTMSKSDKTISEMVDLRIESRDRKSSLNLSGVFVVDEIPVSNAAIDLTKYSHLKDIPICSDLKVHILLGQDNCEALIPLEMRRGEQGDPFAVRTLFGWSVNGPAMTSGPTRRSVINHFVSSVEDQINKLWDIENEGIQSDDPQISQVDQQVLNMWNERVTVVNGHYELPIPWKKDAYVPNNFRVAEARLRSLCAKLKTSNLYEQYDSEIKCLLTKGYAEIVDVNAHKNQIWYLPHHCVVNVNKPGKIRIVFDCSAKYEGESLNQKCNQGPDANNKLLNVLIRFREHDIALMADIEAMYHQVLVPVNDRDALRFIWFDDKGQIVHYRMTRHLFGGIWSGSAATFALRRTVADYGGTDVLIDDTVLNSFYVDDCLRSVTNVSDAIHIVNGVKSLLQKGGFKLTKFVTNDKCLLSSIPECDRAKECNLTDGSSSKALGIRWDFSSDHFQFHLNVDKESRVNRRKMLSTISSMYDPLGIVSPVLILGKIYFQEATRQKLGWDDEIPPEMQKSWRSWVQSLDDLKELRVPRCIKPGRFNDSLLELHHFSDASEKAYGSCSYIRCINKRGEIHTALLFSKSKVAPIKPLSIPRLELQAALLSARIDSMLRRELSIDLAKSHFWVDSEIALKYIKNDTRRFHVFVSNRIGEIRRLTETNQWYHIAGKENPADIISRGQTLDQMDKRKWFQGPDFLRKFKSEWNQGEIDTSLHQDDPEVKASPVSKGENLMSCTTNVDIHPIDTLIEHYSSWTQLRKAVAWLLRAKNIIRSKCNTANAKLSVHELKFAEIVIIKHVQAQFYSKELSDLKHGKHILNSSSLNDLCPMVNEDGLLCVGGRLMHANLSNSAKFPIILPHRHVLAEKIATEIHTEAHLGVEWTLGVMRRKYWITHGRSVIKKIIHKCVRCRRLNAPLCAQKMANLPAERVESNVPPFSFVGLDCFGPFMVKSGRSESKRYGCIFTCLSIRAVHLEVLKAMDTESFLNGFRRFVARRGCPQKVWSDNGSNIVGGRTELAKSLRELNHTDIHRYALQRDIDWTFNPPHASHMGGVWERLIRSVRKVFTSLLMDNTQRLTDEVLQTLFCEVESILNNRPITKVSSDAADFASLTPNHLLLMRQGPDPPPGVFTQNDMYRRRWKYVQYLSDQFWRRWMREYLPELQKRQKWSAEKRNVKSGDLVLLCDEATPRNLWPMGIVLEAKEGRDGLVRSIKVKTKSTILVRPVTKVVLLEGV